MARIRKERELKRKPRFFARQSYDEMRKLRDSAEVASALRQWIPAFQKSGTFLEKVQWVAELCANDKLSEACTRADSLSQNPQAESYSNIFKAINLFEDQKKDKK